MSCCLLIGDYLLRGEPIPFNTVSVMNDPGGNGTFNSGTNALHLVFSDSGTSTLLAGTKSGNQISGEYTVAENSTPVDSGTFTMSLLMHPADPTRLDTTSFRVAGSNLSGMRMPVKQGTEEAYSVTFYGGGIPRRQVAMVGDLNVTGLFSGYYGLTARDILGYTYVGLSYYDNTLDLGSLFPAAMSTSTDNTVPPVHNPGLKTTSCPCTDGFTVQFPVFITTVSDNKIVFSDGKALQPTDTGGDTYTSTVPPAALDFLRTKGALQWQALVRYYKNGEVFRHYSDPQPISF